MALPVVNNLSIDPGYTAENSQPRTLGCPGYILSHASVTAEAGF
jgi:hypothetical protein